MAHSRTLRTDRSAEQSFLPNGHASRYGKGRAILIAGLLLVLAGCGGGSSSNDDPPGQNPPPTQGPPPAPPPPPPPPPQEEPAEPVATEVGTPLDEAVTQAIGPAGGILESADGFLRVEVPEGAFTSEQIVGIEPISNHAHGKIGGAFRLSPEGVTFARPIRLTFYFTPEQIAGTTPQLLRVASQTSDRFWELHEQLTLDADEGTVTVETTHFSDWSLMSGAQLTPGEAIVRPGQTVSLSVVVCERVQPDDLLFPLVAECQPSTVISNLVRNWSVNGVTGGDGTVGTVAAQEDRTALYTAPASAPQQNPVAVSAEYTTLQGELVTLVSNIRVQSGLCTPASPIEPCYFNLFEFNGEGLPYDRLPRESWQNLETVNSGRFQLQDYDGNGEGNWSLRIVWVETRTSTPLERFEQLGGEFTSTPDGQMRFTLPSGTTFTGRIQGNTVSIEDYPFSTRNVSLPVQLRFRQE